MIEDVSKITDKIISIPLLFEHTNKSPAALLHDSGYLENPDEVTVEALGIALERSPEFVDSWLMWSENKRTDSGWYFLLTDSGDYVVGYYPVTENVPSTRYSAASLAGANFIKREIEEIRKLTFDRRE